MSEEITVALVSLGCAKNLVDSEMLSALLAAENFTLVTAVEDADVIIVNTCGFIDSAKEESILTILELAKLKKQKCRALIAAGCLVQRYGEELRKEIPEIDGIFGINDLQAAAETIRRCLAGERPAYLEGKYRLPDDAPRLLATPKHTAYLKIAEGCDNRCTYCAIPAIRGPYRSRSFASIVSEAEKLARQGVRELNLVAQDITLYGKDRGEGRTLPELLRALAAIPGIAWIRLLYAYPERITPKLIDVMAAEEKICAYLDLPIQHGSDKILRRMGRKTTADKLLALIGRLRAAIPGITLRSTFIVGFPGETEEDFACLLAFLEEARLDRVGFFAYSQEEGTPAASFPGQVSQEVKNERLAVALDKQSRIAAAKQKALVGRRLRALVDGRSALDQNVLLLRSQGQAPEVDGYIRVDGGHAEDGSFVNVKITGYDGYDLLGIIETK